MSRNHTLAFVLAGGKGERLRPLTNDRAKPAVPYAGQYRVIDVVLTNLHRSGIRHIAVLTQYKHRSEERHIKRGWFPRYGNGLSDEWSIDTLPATQTDDGGWYTNTANAVYQTIPHITEDLALNPDVIANPGQHGLPPNILIFGGDHIYKMDIGQLEAEHLAHDADLTISAIPVRREDAAGKFGVLTVDEKGRLKEFHEKPLDPAPMPGNPEYCLASMGNYEFKTSPLLEALVRDAAKKVPRTKDPKARKERIAQNPNKYSSHDFGFDVIPAMLREGMRIFVYDFFKNNVPGAKEHERGYWRDIGNIDDYFDANMEVISENPRFRLRHPEWELETYIETALLAECHHVSMVDSLVGPGAYITRATLERSILGPKVTVATGAHVHNSIVHGHATIGENAVITRAIIDKYAIIESGARIGENLQYDLERGCTVSPGGIVVVPRKAIIRK